MFTVLRETARRLAQGADYDWSHQGNCNCGHLVQMVTKLSKSEIHARALEKAGDWGEKVIDYCPTSNYPIDHIITTMLAMGFTRDDYTASRGFPHQKFWTKFRMSANLSNTIAAKM